MTHPQKLSAVLNAWSDFILLESLSNAEVPHKAIHATSGISLQQDSLSIDIENFTALQDKYKSSIEEGKTTIALSFPLVNKRKKRTRLEKGKQTEEEEVSAFPLFSLDITAIIGGEHSPIGWDVSGCETTEAGKNLGTLLGLEKAQTQDWVTKQGPKALIKSAFGIECDTLEAIMTKLTLTSDQWQFSIERRPYIFEFKGGYYTEKLNSDLTEIKELRSPWWNSVGHPAHDYLFTPPSPAQHEQMYLGAFPGHPPTASQVVAIKHANREPLTAVQGPPGSGKTTLVLHLIAQQVVKHALSLIHPEKAKNKNNLKMLVVSSTNNKAVNNVFEKVDKEIEHPLDEIDPVGASGKKPEHALFFLRGGSNTAIKELQGDEQIKEAIEFIETQAFDSAQYQKLEHNILSISTELRDAEQTYLRNRALHAAALTRIKPLRAEAKAISRTITQLRGEQASVRQAIAQLRSYEDLPIEAYQQIERSLDIARQQLPKATTSPIKRFFRRLTAVSDGAILADVRHSFSSAWAAVELHQLSMPRPYTRQELMDCLSNARHSISQHHKLQAEKERVKGLVREVTVRTQQLNEIKAEISQLRSHLLKKDEPDFYEVFSGKYHEQQVALFHNARKYLLQEALRDKTEVLKALKWYQGILAASNKRKEVEESDRSLAKSLNKIALVFPAMGCTLLSIRNMLPSVEACIDRAIIDEAAMTPLHQAFPLLVRSNKAVVVGDPMQIQPIIGIGEQRIERYFEQAFKRRGLDKNDFFKFSPSKTESATVYHRAAGYDIARSSLGRGIQLKEHFRCQPEIIQFCNQIAKYELNILTPREVSKLGTNLVAYHVIGKMQNKVNVAEVDGVQKVILHLREKGYRYRDIGVMSVFKDQANALRRKLNQAFGKDAITTGTVHTFQGDEKPVIILSTRVCLQSDYLDWFADKPNILNVAVSRAKDLFILVGNLHRLESERNCAQKLVGYIREHGEVSEYNPSVDVPYAIRKAETTRAILDCEHIEIFEQAIAQAKESLLIAAPEIAGEAASAFRKQVPDLIKRGIEITVYSNDIQTMPRRSRQQNTEATKEMRSLQKLFAQSKNARLMLVPGEGTNQRILVCDQAFAIIGSWNWLGHNYTKACRNAKITSEVPLREEASYQVFTPEGIQTARGLILPTKPKKPVQKKLSFQR